MRKYNFGVKTALAVFAVALSACSSDNDIVENNSNNQEQPVTNQTMTFRASMDGVTTRTDFNSNSTIWASNDKISILNTADVNEQHPEEGVFTIEAPAYGSTYGKEETFSGTKIKANGNNNDQFYAFYPADADNFTNTNGTVKMTAEVPVVQYAYDGTYDQSLHFMSAYSTNSTFAFKNVCALLKITITNNTNANKVSRIKVVANPTLDTPTSRDFGYTSIAGQFDATIGNDGIASVAPKESEKTFVELRAVGDNGSATESLGEGTFYIAVLPATIAKGFTLFIQRDNGLFFQRVNASTTKFERNMIYDLGTYDVSGALTGSGWKGYSYTEAVDLDLPSGTIWSKKNIKKDGSLDSSESAYTDYFSFGADEVNVVTYSLPEFLENSNTLQGSNDAAYSSKTNRKFCMPVYAQVYELYTKVTNRTLVTDNNIKCAKFTASNGKYIMIPYAGYYYSGRRNSEGSQIRCWTRSYAGSTGGLIDNKYAYCFDLKIENNAPVIDLHDAWGGANAWNDKVRVGRTIRPVAVNSQIVKIY